jgi:hypothetical protein
MKQKNHPPAGEWPLTIACLIENSYFFLAGESTFAAGESTLGAIGVSILGAAGLSIFTAGESVVPFLSPSLPHDAKPRLATAKTMKSFFILM